MLGIYNNHSEVKIIETLLKANNIPYFIKQESFGKISNITFDGLGEIKIYVRKEHIELALKLISKT